MNTYRIKPYQYIHVLNKNNNVSKLVTGPITYIREENEKVTTGNQPKNMIVIPPCGYCEIINPVLLQNNQPVFDKNNQVKLKLGENEVRFQTEYDQPFPLYPGEEITVQPTPMEKAYQMEAFRVKALRDFTDTNNEKRYAGDIWHIPGPMLYRPRVETQMTQIDKACTYPQNTNLIMRADNTHITCDGLKKSPGDLYVIVNPHHYLSDVNETIVQVNHPHILSTLSAIKLTASVNLTDVYGKNRKAGDIWLVTKDMAASHTLNLHEELIEKSDAVVLKENQYCIIQNPYDESMATNRHGIEQLRTGPSVFFIHEGEVMLNNQVLDNQVLKEYEAILVMANTQLTIGKQTRQACERWMEYGPCNYVPPIGVDIIEKRKKIALDKNEGIYVRDIKSGSIRTVIGQTYMLLEHEELWNYPLGDDMAILLESGLEYINGRRVAHKIISYKIPFNSAVQIYDYKSKQSRIVFGPNMVMLQPDETFTMTSLSGKTPKVQGRIKTIHINLGPEFSTDVVVAETSDHAALKLRLSYNWQFRVDRTDVVQSKKIFNVKDFVGDLCNMMANQVRSAVASVDFDTFHKTSARLIRKSVFGVNAEGKVNDSLLIEKNNLEITNIDIQNVEPVNEQTKANLQKTVTMAIEITTDRQEAQALHAAQKLEQEAKGELAQQLIDDMSKAEAFNQKLLQLQAQSNAVQHQGDAVAKARAEAEAAQINGESRLKIADLKAQVNKVINENFVQARVRKQNIAFQHEKMTTELQISKEKQLSEIESGKFQSLIDAIGKNTLVAMAQAGPEFQAELLKGLGLQGFIMTDGNNPINLFDSAAGLIGQANDQVQKL